MSRYGDPGVNYSFIWEKAENKKWKSNYTTWLSDSPWVNGTNITRVDWNKIPLSYCEASHGMLVSLPEKNECYHMYDVFLLSVILVLGTFTLAFSLKMMRNSSYFPNKVRQK